MKRIISVILLLALLISCCACGKNQEEVATDTSDLRVEEKESIRLYSMIDQMVPVDGVYKIWNAEGVKNMAKHPEATFELLCNVYMRGETVPVLGTADAPFTGEIIGNNCSINDFTVEGGEEGAFGFIGVNKGTVKDLFLTGVSFKVSDKAENIGALVGVNEGTILNTSIKGNLMEVTTTAEQVNCGGMVGVNSGDMRMDVAEVDIACAVTGTANAGGLVGLNKGGEMQYNEGNGGLTVTGGKVTFGMFAGSAEDVEFLGCKFLGADNSVDGKLVEVYAGNEKDVTYTECLWRDNNATEPLPDNVRKLRQKVVDAMYEMGTVKWHVTEELVHNCKCGTSGVCVGIYNPMHTYIGMPYKHGSGSLTSFKYVLNEDGSLKDWMYDMPDFGGYDVYIGSMCVSATNMAWWTVSNSMTAPECEFIQPDNQDCGVIPVGEGWWEETTRSSTRYTIDYHEQTTKEVFFNALAQVRMGDVMNMTGEDGNHVVMVATDAVIVRDQEGNISGESFFLTHEQQGGWLVNSDYETKTYTSWRLNYKRTFNAYWNTTGKSRYIPMTCEELLTGEMETPECKMLDGADGQLGLTVGTVKANYFLDAVEMKIVDSEGNAVLERMMFPKAGKPQDANTRLTSLSYIDSYDMANFSVPLQEVQFEKGETYSYTVTGYLATGDVFEVKADSFTFGSAA